MSYNNFAAQPPAYSASSTHPSSFSGTTTYSSSPPPLYAPQNYPQQLPQQQQQPWSSTSAAPYSGYSSTPYSTYSNSGPAPTPQSIPQNYAPSPVPPSYSPNIQAPLPSTSSQGSYGFGSSTNHNNSFNSPNNNHSSSSSSNNNININNSGFYAGNATSLTPPPFQRQGSTFSHSSHNSAPGAPPSMYTSSTSMQNGPGNSFASANMGVSNSSLYSSGSANSGTNMYMNPGGSASTPPPGIQQMRSTSSINSNGNVNSKDLLNDYDPYKNSAASALGGEISVSTVVGKLTRLSQNYKLSSEERTALQVLLARDPRRVNSALDKLEQFDDRSDVTTILFSYQNMVEQRAAQEHQREQHAFQERASQRASAAVSAALAQQRRESEAAAAKAREQLGLDSDDDDDDEGENFETETIVDSDEERRQDQDVASRLQAQFDRENEIMSAPHPRAGGYKDPLPDAFVYTGKELLGTILVRVSKKKLFRKWKPMFFRLDCRSLRLYESSTEYESRSAARLVFPLHACMAVDKPGLKRSYSMADEAEHFFFATFKENILDGISDFEMPKKYSPLRRNRRLCKFGSVKSEDIVIFAHALHGVIIWNRRQRALGSASQNAGRYSEGD
mmetsp:Transcript_12105/g.20577  ORF Transcript_12105/g.20577 Transcript_12105/m.20577 type:complete len:616 (+) Transcript_12105:150-1997(+)